MEKRLFQVIFLAYDEKNIVLSANSLCSQKKPVGFDVKVIYVDSVKSDISRSAYDSLAKKYSACYVEAQSGISECIKTGISAMSDDAFMFCRSGSVYSKGALRAICKAFSNGATAVTVHPVLVRHINTRLGRLFSTSSEDLLKHTLSGGDYTISEYPQIAHTALDAYAFSAGDFNLSSVEYLMENETEHTVVFSLLSRICKVTYIADEYCTLHQPLESALEAFPHQHEHWWYLDSVKNFYIPMLKKLSGESHLNEAVQYIAVHLLVYRIVCNYDEKNKEILSHDESSELIDLIAEAFTYLDNKVILKWCDLHRWSGRGETRKVLFHRSFAMKLLNQKADMQGSELTLKDADNKVFLCEKNAEDLFLCEADEEILDVKVINYENNTLSFDATFSAADFIPHDEVELWCECGNDVYKINHCQVYPLLKCFGKTFTHTYNVKFDLPADNGLSFRFYYKLGNSVHNLKLRFDFAFSRLVSDKPHSYWCFRKGSCLVCKDSRTVEVKKLSGFGHFTKEIAFIASMFSFKSANKLLALASIGIRCFYRITRPFYGKKRRWVTFDKLYKGGDNGEYFFRYAATRKDDIRVYYIVNKGTKEYKQLKKKYRYVLKGVSLRTTLTSLNSEAIAATHSTVVSYLGFPKTSIAFLKDLFNFKIVCIQHGLTVQQIAQYQNRIFDNTTLYCLASHIERENLLKPIYDFEEKHLKMNGLARFDGLVNNDKRFILITPTWRRNIVATGIANMKKSYSEIFKGSEYYRLYNNLINDPTLIECAKRCGYGITYLLHPAMSAQINDFDKNDYVKLVAASGDMSYEKILTEASLMVTDYSGVQFDFAYMRKPVVYYHPDTLPPQYESGSIDYPTTGFGPICTQHDELVRTLCGYIENQCANSPEYIDRANTFFEYDDYNNCARIYDEILKYTNKN